MRKIVLAFMNNKNLFILMMCVCVFLCSCSHSVGDDEQVKKEPSDVINAVLDSLAIYKTQTDKSVMLTNLIHYQSGKYVLDLSLDEAKKLGVTEMMYNQVLEHVSQLNNCNLERK